MNIQDDIWLKGFDPDVEKPGLVIKTNVIIGYANASQDFHDDGAGKTAVIYGGYSEFIRDELSGDTHVRHWKSPYAASRNLRSTIF